MFSKQLLLGVVVVKGKQFVYTDELNDDFAGIKRSPYIIGSKYKYKRTTIVWKFVSFIVYRLIMTPFTYLYIKIKFHHKVVGGKLLRANKKGCFLYGNHTLMMGDAGIPNVINCHKKTYTIVHGNNLSIPIVRTVLKMCGAIPLPNTVGASKNFLAVIKNYIQDNNCIMIYPEAHIWPYYTGIRGFRSGSFRYPIEFNAPTYSITNTFHKKRWFSVPKIITYIDGPFWADSHLSKKEQVEDLRNKVYLKMKERAQLNTYSVNVYIKGD